MAALKSILVGLDGSSFGTAAMELGVGWAQRAGASLAGLAVVDLPAIRMPEAVPLGGMAFKEQRDDALAGDAHRRLQAVLEKFQQRCAEAAVSCESLETIGHPAEQILLESQRHDLILLGQRTYFHFETQEDADETLRSVVKGASRPVIAVPAKPRKGEAVVVAYDGSPQAARTLQAFQSLGLHGPHVVHVVGVDPDAVEAKLRLERAVDYLERHDIKSEPHAVATSDPPARAILDLVNSLDCGLLVMGAYGQSPFKELLFGSVTRTILEESITPVFLYH